MNAIVPKLEEAIDEEDSRDFTVDEKTKQIYLTELGHSNVESILNGMGLLEAGESLYDPQNIRLMHHINAAIRAHKLFQKDVDYIVKEGEVIIVDEFTGRTMAGRRWSDGLHQAVEAKENLRLKKKIRLLHPLLFKTILGYTTLIWNDRNS